MKKIGLDEMEVGSIVTLNNSTDGKSKSKDLGHTGIISEIVRDDNGAITTLKMIDSGGTAGPRPSKLISGGKKEYWGKRITGVYKWDSPDVNMLKEVVVQSTRIPTRKNLN